MIRERLGSPRITISGLVLALIASWSLFGLSSSAATASPGQSTAVSARTMSQELFINLQSGREDLHRVNMAFQMARNQRATGRPAIRLAQSD